MSFGHSSFNLPADAPLGMTEQKQRPDIPDAGWHMRVMFCGMSARKQAPLAERGLNKPQRLEVDLHPQLHHAHRFSQGIDVRGAGQCRGSAARLSKEAAGNARGTGRCITRVLEVWMIEDVEDFH